jgi:hypothetical protein
VAREDSSVVAREKVADQALKKELALWLIQQYNLSCRLGCVNAVGGRDDTTLQIAHRERNIELVELLLDNGVCIHGVRGH